MYILDKLSPNCWLLKIYTPNGRGMYSYEVPRYIDALKVIRKIGLPLKEYDKSLEVAS